MKLPAGHARRLFLGFTCSVMFLVVFALLIAHNSEAESASHARAAVDEYPLTIPIPTGNPEGTISFYKKLGFKTTDALSSGLDVVRMEKQGTPYKLEICHHKSSDSGHLAGGVSGMSFRVSDLRAAVNALQGKGLIFQEKSGKRDGVSCASLLDPNGISIKLFEPRQREVIQRLSGHEVRFQAFGARHHQTIRAPHRGSIKLGITNYPEDNCFRSTVLRICFSHHLAAWTVVVSRLSAKR